MGDFLILGRFEDNYEWSVTRYNLPVSIYHLPVTNYPLPLTNYHLENKPFCQIKPFSEMWLEFTKTISESQILQIVNFSTKHSDVKKYIALYILKFMIFFYKGKFFFTKNFLYKKISR